MLPFSEDRNAKLRNKVSFEQQQKKKKFMSPVWQLYEVVYPRDSRCRNLERKLNRSYKNESHQQWVSESMECVNVYEKLKS